MNLFKKHQEERALKNLHYCLDVIEDTLKEARRAVAKDQHIAVKLERVVHALAWGNANAQQALTSAIAALGEMLQYTEGDENS